MLRYAVALSALLSFPGVAATPRPIPAPLAVDARIAEAMTATHAKGLAIAIIDDGKVAYVKSYGVRNAAGDPLQTDTVMYGASLTKTVFAYTVLQLVDQGKLKLDTPIADDLDKPLVEYDPEAIYPEKYGPYKDLASDPRWKLITPRHVMTHSTGFANFWWLEPDQKLRIHFDPGSRYAYSGEGQILLQFAIDNGKTSQGLGVDLGKLTQDQVFTPLGMTRTSLMWRADFRPNLADGFNDKGEAGEHDERSKVRAAGSMDTTISDLSKFAAALVSGQGLSPASRAEMVRPQLKITTAHQFPPFAPELPAAQQRKDLYAGLGVIVFDGPQGHGFLKGGHDGQTANTLICIEAHKRCVLILSNDVRSEAAFADIVQFILGDTGVPYDWEYGDQAGKS
ncbi:serine hydrolase domain-containing protein [Asticcacaulis sp. 201]|uniref:serine hydrolase domain-containing protein n=1 Tax=Asticcacaulis sp. 201 TaxID=3028787 RepID=UPI002915D7C2|nr:serine hydrolase domain-containing protein [Asticcacaulis sp. 201]MDV6332863.1 serine hydrolase domain-containing protein [Asticcacaulis sp. 201]